MELYYVEIIEYENGDIGDTGYPVEKIGPFDKSTAYSKAEEYNRNRTDYRRRAVARPMPSMTRSDL